MKVRTSLWLNKINQFQADVHLIGDISGLVMTERIDEQGYQGVSIEPVHITEVAHDKTF
jgi:limonene-1,2-epoxide hydrolase